MSISDKISTELASLQGQVAAAQPLAQAPIATVKAIKLNAAQLVSDVQSELIADQNILDTWTAPVDPAAITSGILSVAVAGQDQFTLSYMRGVVGRATSNLDQIPS